MDRLIVFRKVYEYLFWLKPTVERFTKVHKYSLGVEMQANGLQLLKRIIAANYVEQKDLLMTEALVEYEVQRVYLRLAFEYKLVTKRQFEFASNLLDEIARLLRGWARHHRPHGYDPVVKMCSAGVKYHVCKRVDKV